MKMVVVADGLGVCGNSVPEADVGEECDHGPENADDGACTRACKVARCGDGLLVAPGLCPTEEVDLIVSLDFRSLLVRALGDVDGDGRDDLYVVDARAVVTRACDPLP